MKERRDKVNYYLDLAESVSHRGTCLHPTIADTMPCDETMGQ